ncbi:MULTISPECIES: hypothetical protein [unclassified Luteibacter]|uniref:hypothetical protein n=1 Tax=Luteibacter sp. PvP019 TaxID=3156436 RepID=UPI00339493AC
MALVMRDRLVPRMSWGAAIAGCVFSLVTYLALGVLGTAIGASTIDPLREANPVSGLATGAGIWVVVTSLVSVIVGAFVAGRLASVGGGMHGLLTWALTSLITTWLLASLAGSAAGAAGAVVGKGLSLTGAGIAAAAPGVADGLKDQLDKQGIHMDWKDLQGQLETTLRQTDKPELNPETLKDKAADTADAGKQAAGNAAQTPQGATDDLAAWFDRLRSEGKPAIEAADRDALVNIIAARTGKSHDEAAQIADNYISTYRQAVARYDALKATAEQKAREAADVAARGVSRAAWMTLAMLVLGAIASFVAGIFGRRSAPVVDA